MKALEVEKLYKKYPAFTLNGISFSVEEGRIVGLIGRNGAGKTTTIKGILNLISTTGEVRLFGTPFLADEGRAKSLIGYVGGGFRFYPLKRLSAITGTVKRFFPAWDDARYRRLLSQFALDENKKVSELSEGMKVKFSVALALSRGARLLIMDEPTSGLDPLSREEFCDTVLSLVQNEGVSVLFSTHITSDLERIADDVVYLSDGRVIIDEPLKTLASRYLLVRFENEGEARACGVPVYGLKRVKEGYEGLVDAARADVVKGGECATLEQIIVHLEREGERS